MLRPHPAVSVPALSTHASTWSIRSTSSSYTATPTCRPTMGPCARQRARTGKGISTRWRRAPTSSARRTCSALSDACSTSGRTISATTCAASAYRGHHADFKRVLKDARDWTVYALATIWASLRPATLTFAEVGRAPVEVDRKISGCRFAEIIGVDFRRRAITPSSSVSTGARSFAPTAAPIRPACRQCDIARAGVLAAAPVSW
jgi:hypothetical protein